MIPGLSIVKGGYFFERHATIAKGVGVKEFAHAGGQGGPPLLCKKTAAFF